jgi:hypothetical protein
MPCVQTDPAVAYGADNFVVVWADARFTGSYYWLTAAAVDTNGVLLDTCYCIGTQTSRNELWPDIAFDGVRYLVVWYSSEYPYGVYGRFVNTLGQPEDTLLIIKKTLASNNLNPCIEYMADRYFVVWADKRLGYSDLDVFGQMVSSDGQFLGSMRTIASGSANQMYPAVCSDGSRFFVVWREGMMAICGQWFDMFGSPVGDILQVSDSTSLYRFRAGIDASSNGCLAAWSEAHNDVTDIFGSIETSAGDGEIPCYDYGSSCAATIWRGSFRRPMGQGGRIYDVCGRDVTNVQLSCGVFYVQDEGSVMKKIVIVE